MLYIQNTKLWYLFIPQLLSLTNFKLEKIFKNCNTKNITLKIEYIVFLIYYFVYDNSTTYQILKILIRYHIYLNINYIFLYDFRILFCLE